MSNQRSELLRSERSDQSSELLMNNVDTSQWPTSYNKENLETSDPMNHRGYKKADHMIFSPHDLELKVCITMSDFLVNNYTLGGGLNRIKFRRKIERKTLALPPRMSM